MRRAALARLWLWVLPAVAWWVEWPIEEALRPANGATRAPPRGLALRERITRPAQAGQSVGRDEFVTNGRGVEAAVSDARPITNVTEFVCGECWSSFSRSDPGVLRGDDVVCPHCRHAQPLLGSEDLAQMVRNAPGRGDVDDIDDPNDLDDDFDLATERAVPIAPGSLTPATALSRVEAAPPAVVVAEPIGHVAGDSADWEADVDVDEPTPLPEDIDAIMDEANVAEVRVTRRLPTVESDGFVVGDDELDIDLHEPTPVDAGPSTALFSDEGFDDYDEAFGETFDVQQRPPRPGVVSADTAEQDAEALAVALAVHVKTAEAHTDDGEFDREFDDDSHAKDPAYAATGSVEVREWKLRAMGGITYNFHSLDAMLGWANNKSGMPMTVSLDGEVWRDFGAFHQRVRAGMDPQEAFGQAEEPIGAVGQDGDQPSAIDAIQAVDARESGEFPADHAAATAAVAGGNGSGASQAAPAAKSSKQATKAAAKTGAKTGATSGAQPRARSASGQVHKSGARSPSGTSQKAGGLSGAPRIVAVVLAVAVGVVVVAGILHMQGVVRIPGLP